MLRALGAPNERALGTCWYWSNSRVRIAHPPLSAGERTRSPWIANLASVIFKAVGDSKPYPDHGYAADDWATVPPGQVRLAELITTTRTLDLDRLLADDSTFFGDLFAHVVKWQGNLYLEDGLHRAVRAALQQRPLLHARVLDLDAGAPSEWLERQAES